MTAADDDYDALPYTTHAYAESHPDRLAAVGLLSGWRAPALDGARILEIGCARGGNLLAMALSLPSSTLVGVERSEVQAAEARSLAERLGIGNVTIHRGSFEEVARVAPFDYVVAHGVCSWIPPDERRSLLRTARALLSPDGIAYVSFNVLPGWYERLASRDWLRFAGELRAFQGAPAGKTAGWLAGAISPEQRAYKEQAARVAARLAETSEAYAAHEFVRGDNHPQLVGEFLREATDAGLAYLGDAIPARVAQETLAEQVRAMAQALEPSDAQQLVDFVRGTSFRSALLVRADTASRRGWRWPARLDAAAVSGLRIASRLSPTERGELFATAGRAELVQVTDPSTERALLALAAAAPRSLPFADLVRGAPEPAARALGAEIVDLWLSAEGLDLHVFEPGFVTRVPARPRGCPLARWQVARGEPVTNRWHQEVRLTDTVARSVLARADGARTAREIADAMHEGEALVSACLELLAKSALLVD